VILLCQHNARRRTAAQIRIVIAGEPKLDAAIRIRLLSGFLAKVGDRDLSRPLLREHPERLADNRVVLDLVSMAVTKDQNRCSCLFSSGGRGADGARSADTRCSSRGRSTSSV
jgi:hypothetical protein